MSTPDLEEKARNREIAQNEVHRKAISAVRISGWAIFLALVIAAIVVGLGWAWTHR
ncbi:hypothetical protein [Bradyrhizobium sp.]|uniref:hypothetical protein n=1 Tax=Bradyrhizobium sp. TaxID=376 RepID=UPI001DDFC81E|nr:hypothetical protein [Bradyrhizobium sp.]MBI5320199.1 hypothetical protein [Bradyrhizobium sp.]